MAQNLDLRCVLLSDPSTFGAGGSQPKHVSKHKKVETSCDLQAKMGSLILLDGVSQPQHMIT